MSRRKQKTTRRNVLRFESLETRQMMAADIGLDQGVLSVVGTPEADVIEVSQEANRLRVEVSNEDGVTVREFGAIGLNEIRMEGGSGNDRLFNGTSIPATIRGGEGDDVIVGGSAGDTLSGGDGSDFIVGGSSGDSIKGGSGDDQLYGGGGADWIYGGTGDDQLIGDDGNDVQFGNGGDDVLDGDRGDDYLNGGEGADIILGGLGDDRLVGGVGNDRLDGGEGEDIAWGEMGNDNIAGRGGADQLIGGPGADSVFGGAGNDRLWGNEGDDLLSGDPGDDRIAAGAGDDTAHGGAGRDVLHGQAGRDQLFGGDDIDWIYGGDGDDFVDYGSAARELDAPTRLSALKVAFGEKASELSDQLPDVVATAMQRWHAVGLDTVELDGVTFRIADLPGSDIGLAVRQADGTQTIWLDVDAAGAGWFIDDTPGENTEFFRLADAVGVAMNDRMDLLTVVAHEIGHLAGIQHTQGVGLLSGQLLTSVRLLPTPEIVRSVPLERPQVFVEAASLSTQGLLGLLGITLPTNDRAMQGLGRSAEGVVLGSNATCRDLFTNDPRANNLISSLDHLLIPSSFTACSSRPNPPVGWTQPPLGQPPYYPGYSSPYSPPYTGVQPWSPSYLGSWGAPNSGANWAMPYPNYGGGWTAYPGHGGYYSYPSYPYQSPPFANQSQIPVKSFFSRINGGVGGRLYGIQ